MISAPFTGELLSLRDAVDRLVSDSFLGGPFHTVWSRTGTTNGSAAVPLPLDVYATNDAVVVIAAAPGMHPDDLDISFQQGTLILTGKVANVADSQEAKNATWYAHELWSGTFRRTVTLPFEIDADKAEATFEHGIVRIVLPKAEQAKPKKIAVRVGQPTEAIAAPASNA